MLVCLLLICAVGVVLSADTPPPKCCTDREFEVTMGEVAGSMYNQHGHYVQTFIQGYNKLYYDAHSEKMAIDAVITSNGNTTSSKIIIDYTTKHMYVSAQDGSCKRYPVIEGFRAPCIPADAIYDGTSYIGYGTQQLQIVSWRYLEPGTDHVIRYSVTREGCIPVVLTNLGHYLQNKTLLSDTFFLYNGFKPGITKPSVFNSPTGCSDGDNFVPVPIGRSLRGIRAAYTTL